MSEQQIGQINTLADKLVEFQRHFGQMPTEDCQWAIQNTKAAIDLFATAVKNRNSGSSQGQNPANSKLLEMIEELSQRVAILERNGKVEIEAREVRESPHEPSLSRKEQLATGRNEFGNLGHY